MTKVIFCTGKIYYELVAARAKSSQKETSAIIRIEELVPFPVEQIEGEIKKFANAKHFIWFQEESQNAGAW